MKEKHRSACSIVPEGLATAIRGVDDIIEHLKTIYDDANRVSSAKRAFGSLYMDDTKFQVFLSKFVLNAQESELPATLWKDELYERLSPEMQKRLVEESYDDAMFCQSFVRECHRTANCIEMIAENEKRASKPRDNRGSDGNGACQDNKMDKLRLILIICSRTNQFVLV